MRNTLPLIVIVGDGSVKLRSVLKCFVCYNNLMIYINFSSKYGGFHGKVKSIKKFFWIYFF